MTPDTRESRPAGNGTASGQAQLTADHTTLADWERLLDGWSGKYDGRVTRWYAAGVKTAVAVTDGDRLEMFATVGDLRARTTYRFEEVAALLAMRPLPAYDPAVEALEAAVDQLRIREEARRRLAAERADAVEIPTPQPLSAFLADDPGDPEYLVDRLLPTGGNVILAAQYKAGKSLTAHNLVRALADGAPFLGRFDTRQATVTLIDDELDPRNLRRWLREQQIEHPERVNVIPLRGRVGAFDILDDTTRAKWAQHLRGSDVLIFDCLRPVLDALGLDENKDAGRFLVAFDALTATAGISEAVIVHHMGHGGARSRGDSRILDWPDATWSLTREKPDDPASPRYFAAFGRDVNQEKAVVEYQEEGRRLTLGGSPRDAAISIAAKAAIELLSRDDNRGGLPQLTIETTLKGDHARSDVREALRRLNQRGDTAIVPGPRGAKLHVLIQLAGSQRRARGDQLAAGEEAGEA